jgi:hypothetical protein
MNGPIGKGVGTRNANAPKTHDTEQRDSASDEGTRKPFATLRAELVVRGYGLHEHHFESRWNVARQLPDLRAVRVMLMQIGGRR